jgi:hypothetical protein
VLAGPSPNGQDVCQNLLKTPQSRVSAFFDLLSAEDYPHLNKAAKSVKVIDRKNWFENRTAVALDRGSLWFSPSLLIFTPNGYEFNNYRNKLLISQISIRLAELAVRDALFSGDARSYLPFLNRENVQEKLRRLTEIEAELYRLFLTLKLHPSVLPREDKGIKWVRNFLYMKRPQHSISPIFADYSYWLLNGDDGLYEELEQRYGKMYRTQAGIDFVKRLMALSILSCSITSTITAITHHKEIELAIQNVDKTAAALANVSDRTLSEDFQKRRAIRAEEERARLTKRILDSKDAREQAALKRELTQLTAGL